MLKLGKSNLAKAGGFHDANNWPQTIRHADLSVTKLKQLKDRPIKLMDEALALKCNALNMIGHYREGLEAAKERYCLYLTCHTHPPAIYASFEVIQCCIHNKEYADAILYARTLWETITLSRDSHIPDKLREEFTARGALELSRAMFRSAESENIPVNERVEAGIEAIVLARRALEIYTQLHGAESSRAAIAMLTLANVLGFFHDDNDDDEVQRLLENAKDIFAREENSLSANVTTCEKNLGNMYTKESRKARVSKDLDRLV